MIADYTKKTRDERRHNESSSAAAAANRRRLHDSNAKAARDESRFNSTFGSNEHKHRNGRVTKASRDEERFKANFKGGGEGNSLQAKAKRLVGNASGENPTASGGGRGGKMDREWQNHKWITRTRGYMGKWQYEYQSDNKYGIGIDDMAKHKRNRQREVKDLFVKNTNPTASGSGASRYIPPASKGAKSILDEGYFKARHLINVFGMTPLNKLFK